MVGPICEEYNKYVVWKYMYRSVYEGIVKIYKSISKDIR